MSALDELREAQRTWIDTIAGLLAASSVVVSAIAMGGGLLLQVDATPARLGPVAVVLALVAARMSERTQTLALRAALFAALAWVVGMAIVVVTDGPLL